MEYQSIRTVESRTCPGVRFQVRRLSLARRMELVQLIREAGESLEFHAAGEGVSESAQAAEIRARVDELYVRWGLSSLEGLRIDGEAATTETLLNAGPDALAREVADAVRSELFLDEEERKN